MENRRYWLGLGPLIVSLALLSCLGFRAEQSVTTESAQQLQTVETEQHSTQPTAPQAFAEAETKAADPVPTSATVSTYPARQTTPTETVADPTAASAASRPVYGGNESYFDDTLFIGDSLSTGLRDCARLGDADYFAVSGMGIFTLFDNTASDHGFSEQDLVSLLSSKTYAKIYFFLGVNDSGRDLESFRGKYAQCLQKIRDLQPDAIIILGCNLPLGREKSASASCFGLEHQGRMNEIIRSFADDETIFCIDAAAVLADEDGYLPDEYSGDGLHLKVKYYEVWSRFICDNPVDIP